MGRYLSVWFRYLATDWFALRQPALKWEPFVLRTPQHGKMVITAVNARAAREGVHIGMALADARALIPGLQAQDDIADLRPRLLRRLAEWCIRFTPSTAIDLPDGLLLDATGCPHLWGGEEKYVNHVVQRLQGRGYTIRAAMADTVGAAWGVARYGSDTCVVPPKTHRQALLPLPPEALRPEPEAAERLHKLGLHAIRQFMDIPKALLRRRFGNHLLLRLNQALGTAPEIPEPVQQPEPYCERLPCLEPIITAQGIDIALRTLLTTLCKRLQQAQMGLRRALFTCYRVDGKVQQVSVGTHRPTHHVEHLMKLFALKVSTLEPDLGFELFVLEAHTVEPHLPQQQKMWESGGGLHDVRLTELIDRLAGRVGSDAIQRYLPAEHHWPERSYRLATPLYEKMNMCWARGEPRPIQVLPRPEPIAVTAPIPDYPPMLFRYRGKIHTIVKADGPERIEQEWWLQQGQHRDYYRVEDEAGNRYWLFRLGHYHDEHYQWYLHGFFS